MKSCKHPNVLECYTSFVTKNYLWIIMPYMSMGSCHRIISKLRELGLISEGEGLKEEWIGAIMNEVGKGLSYLHSLGYVHRDIKAGNILMNADGEIKVADFGVAGMIEKGADKSAKCKTFVGTPCWMAPEVIEQTNYSERADIWSFGITLLELLKGYAPYAKEAPMKVLLKTLQNDAPSLKTYDDNKHIDVSSAFTKAYQACLIKSPEKRPTIEKVLGLKFFSQCLDLSVVKRDISGLVPPLEETPDDYVHKKVELINIQNVGDKIVFTNAIGENEYVPGTTWTFSVPTPTTEENKDDDISIEAELADLKGE